MTVLRAAAVDIHTQPYLNGDAFIVGGVDNLRYDVYRLIRSP